MRLLILSDLHREIWYRPGTRPIGWVDPFPRIDLEASCPDVVILAGDIDVGARAVEWADQTFAGVPVVYVHGNHEGYGQNLSEVQKEIAHACATTGHIHYLEGQEKILGGVRFLGTPLWTDFRLHGKELAEHRKAVATRMINDYQQVRVGRDSRKLQPNDAQRWHFEQVRWLKARIAEPFAGKTVVVTHMAPSERSLGGEFKTDPLSAAYATHLDHWVEQVDLWVHGHVHHSLDYHIGAARVVCNPLGYPGSFQRSRAGNMKFDPNLIVEV